jgi:hypothetical protein
MTTNQTIDGVPRDDLELVLLHGHSTHESDRAWDRLRALLEAPPRCPVCGYTEQDCREQMDHYLCGSPEPAPANKPAAQPQGVPVAWLNVATGHVTTSAVVVMDWDDEKEQVQSLYAEQPAPVAALPDGYCIMPRQLTAENGAKALLLGEFKLLATMECPECCELDEPTEGCSICDGEGEYGQKHTIPWDQIKFIYSKAVAGLALKAESAKSR